MPCVDCERAAARRRSGRLGAADAAAWLLRKKPASTEVTGLAPRHQVVFFLSRAALTGHRRERRLVTGKRPWGRRPARRTWATRGHPPFPRSMLDIRRRPRERPLIGS